MTEKEKNTFGVVRRVRDGLSSFRLEAERSGGGMSLRFAGIIGVCEFSESEIVIKNHSGKVRVTGRRLFICGFENNQVEICGRVEEIGFTYGKN